MRRGVLVITCDDASDADYSAASASPCGWAPRERETLALAALLHRAGRSEGPCSPGRAGSLEGSRPLGIETTGDCAAACQLVSGAVEAGEPYAVAFVERAALGTTEHGVARALQDLWLADATLPIVLVERTGENEVRFPGPVAGPPTDERLLRAHSVAGAAALAVAVLGAWSDERRRRRRLRRRLARAQRRNAELRLSAERHRRDARRLRRSALHDTLTNLPNRALMMDRLNRCVARAAREPDYVFAVLFLDVDDFKFVNDSLGHDVGDAVLLELARRLSASLRTLDTIARQAVAVELTAGDTDLVSGGSGAGLDLSARLGGDEFVVVLEGVRNVEDAVRVAERLQQQLAAPIQLPGRELSVTTSMGIAIGRGAELSAAALLREADGAMYRAKVACRGQFALFDGQMHEAANQRLRAEAALREALERDELEVLYQPIVSLERFEVHGFEALLRWHRPELGTVGPAEFIPLAEEAGLILPIQRWVLQAVLRQVRQWNERFAGGSQSVWASVNVSGRQLEREQFAQDVLAQIEEAGLDPRLLRLELKQACLRRRGVAATAAAASLELLRQRGVQVCIDDFGSAAAGLAELRRLPADLLKIDRGVAVAVESSRDWAAVVEAMTKLAHALGKRVVVEGIETSQQMREVDRLECDYAQGYFFARPLSAAAATKFIHAPPKWRLAG